ncbi:MAG: TonB-dependent receptor [Deltaproteobacteria bacterium]|jgi:iron complex outermembrane receptor protein|nr:TonB-dependent receptor [Deltaproteobacteria bacterium]
MSIHTRSVWAQTAGAAASSNLPQIDVRGEVRRTELQTTSATIVGHDQIMNRPYDKPIDMLKRFPGMIVNFNGSWGVAPSMNIRGFGGGHGGNDINFYLDGIPLNDNGHATGYFDTNVLLPIEIDYMEIIKGPSSIYYGQRSAGGSIALQTIKRGNFNRLNLRYGSYNDMDVMGLIGRDHGKFAQLYAFEVYHSDGYRENDKRDKKNFSGRWTYSFSENFEMSLNLRAYQSTWEAPGNISYLYRKGRKDWVDDGSGEGGGGFRDRYDGRLWANYLINDRSQLTFYLYGTTLETSRYEKTDGNTGPASLATGGGEDYSRHRSWGSGLTYSYMGEINGRAATASLGFNYSYEEELPRTFYDFGKGTGRTRTRIGRYNENLTIENPGILAEATYQLTDMFNLRLGGRYDWIYGEYQDLGHRDSASGTFIPRGELMQSPAYRFFSPKVGVLFTPRDRYSFYANFGRGFSLPSMNGGASGFFNGENAFALKKRDQYEVGMRASVTDWLDLDLSIFKIFTENDTQYDEVLAREVPAGKTERHGLELEAKANPTPDWTLAMNYSYLQTKYKSFKTSSDDLAGHHMTGLPAHMLNLEVEYHPQSLPFGGRISYHGEFKRLARDVPAFNMNGNPNDAPLKSYAPSFHNLDVMMYYRVNENCRVLFNVNNVFDKIYYSGLTPPTPHRTSGDFVYQTRPPRTFYLTIEMKWDPKPE